MKAVLYCRASTSGPFSLDMIRGQQLCLLDYAKENRIEIAGIYSAVSAPPWTIPACRLFCRPSGRVKRTRSL